MISTAFAQTAQTAATSQTDQWIGLLPFIALFVIMYFMFIRPQQKRAKEHKKMIDTLQKGDEVMLAGGIVARIQSIDDPYVKVEISKGVDIQIQKNAVQALLPKNTLTGF